MVVKIRKMYSGGDETQTLTQEEAQNLIETEKGRYFVVDAATKKILKEVKVEDGQELLLVPILSGG